MYRLFNFTCLTLILQSVIIDCTDKLARMELTLIYVNPTNHEKNHDDQFQICMKRNPIYYQDTCNIYEHRYTMTIDHAKVQHVIEAHIPQPLPKFYQIDVQISRGNMFYFQRHIANFSIKHLQVPADGEHSEFVLQHIDQSFRDQTVRLSGLLKFECEANSTGNDCQIHCDPQSLTHKCDHNWRRICPPNLFGENCEQFDWCTDQPCSGSATCTPFANNTGRECVCNIQTDTDCHLRYEPCKLNPCSNGGECVPDNANSSVFSCHCKLPWIGSFCDERRWICPPIMRMNGSSIGSNVSNPCLNNGSCLEILDTLNYTCICSDGWKGEHCNIPVHVSFFNRRVTLVASVSVCSVLICILVLLLYLWNRSLQHTEHPEQETIVVLRNKRKYNTTGSLEEGEHIAVRRVYVPPSDSTRLTQYTEYEDCGYASYIDVENNATIPTGGDIPPPLPARPSEMKYNAYIPSSFLRGRCI